MSDGDRQPLSAEDWTRLAPAFAAASAHRRVSWAWVEPEARGRFGRGKKAKALEKKRRKKMSEDASDDESDDASDDDSEEEDFSDAESDGENGAAKSARTRKKPRAAESDENTSVQARLQELGPRFTLKLMSVQKGTFDSEHGEYEYVRNGETDGTKHNRRKFVL